MRLVWWTGLSTEDWYFNGQELYSATRRFVSTRLSGRLPSKASQK